MRYEIPYIGEVRLGREVGKRSKWGRYVWSACVECGQPRWVSQSALKKGGQLRCQKCSNKHIWIKGSGAFVESRRINKKGYAFVRIKDDSPFYSMADRSGYIAEHRLVMAYHLGRIMKSWEIVHHKHDRYPADSKPDKSDNRIENLRLVTVDNHAQITVLERKMMFLERENAKLTARISTLENRITLLEAEGVLNQSQAGESKIKSDTERRVSSIIQASNGR